MIRQSRRAILEIRSKVLIAISCFLLGLQFQRFWSLGVSVSKDWGDAPLEFLTLLKMEQINGVSDMRVEKPDSATLKDSDPDLDSKKNSPLNVVVFYPDDWRHDSLEDERPGLIHTPFLSQLAKEGIRFTRNAVTTSICWISRATYFTGRYASQHMALKLPCPTFVDFPWWRHSWPHMLRTIGGYHVGHVGKWQFYNSDKWQRSLKAFDWTSFHEGSHWLLKKNMTSGETKNTPASELAMIDTIDFLRQRPKDKAFAVTVAFYPPKAVGTSTEPGGQWTPNNESYSLYKDHDFQPPYNFSQAFESLPPFLRLKGAAQGRYKERYSTLQHYQEAMKRYFALVTQIDMACKQIVDELKRQRVYDNTMIIFTSDNGLFQGAHGLAGKWHPYEESIRVPLIIRDPRISHSRRGTLDDSFTLNIDLATTILGAAGIKPSPLMQGKDIATLYEASTILNSNTTVWRDNFYYEFPIDNVEPSEALITTKWKYIQYPKQNKYEQLFDLENDPYELKDEIQNPAYESILNELREMLLRERNLATNGTKKPVCNKTRVYG